MSSASSTGIKKRQLGRTGIEITPIGLGCWQFAQGKGFDRFVYEGLPQELVNDVVKTVWEGGINWFDTAEAYGWGRSERSLAAALGAAGIGVDEALVATKWFPPMRTAESIGRTIVKRRRCLKPYGIGLYQIHQPVALASVEKQMNAMADLVDLGLVGSVGVSNFPEKMVRKAHAVLEGRGLPLASNQVKVSLMDRHIETNGMLKTAKELGMTIIAWSPLEMGVLTGKFHKDPALLKTRPIGRRGVLWLQLQRSRKLIEALEEIASANGVSPAVVALSWIVNYYGDTVVAIPGATKVSQAEQNIMANEFKLSEKETARIEQLSARFRNPLPFI
jgi:aryl-alcohol dehydrogenase-like predicted oxidoreductase